MFKFKYEKIAGYFCVIAPIISYWVYWTLHPSYWLNGDPAAFYLIDSLSIFAGKSYTYVDHPGTPIHIIGTLMLALTYPFFKDTNAFIHFYIAKPVVFFIMGNSFLLISSMVTAGVFYHTAYLTLKRFRLAGAMALTMAYFVLHPQSYQSLTLWSHNSLNFPIGTLWLVWLYRELIQEKKLEIKKLLILGLTAGILASAQIYFFTWVASGVFIVFLYTAHTSRSYKAGISASQTFILGSIAGLISMLLPVYRELPRFVAWLFQITTHTGSYGTGEIGIFSIRSITTAIHFWWTTIPLIMVLIITAFFTTLWLVYQARQVAIKIPPSISAMIMGLMLQTGLLLILFTKAAVRLRYTLALAAILPVLLLLTINLFEIVDLRKAKWIGAIYAIILIGMAITFSQQLKLVQDKSYYEEEVQTAKTKVVHNIAKELGISEDKVKIVMAYGTPLKCVNMLIASDYTGHFKQEISAICPNQYGIYDIPIQLNPAEPLIDIRSIKWDLVIWPGNGSNLPDYLESVGAVNIPSSWRIQRSAWYFIHSDAIKLNR